MTLIGAINKKWPEGLSRQYVKEEILDAIEKGWMSNKIVPPLKNNGSKMTSNKWHLVNNNGSLNLQGNVLNDKFNIFDVTIFKSTKFGLKTWRYMFKTFIASISLEKLEDLREDDKIETPGAETAYKMK